MKTLLLVLALFYGVGAFAAPHKSFYLIREPGNHDFIEVVREGNHAISVHSCNDYYSTCEHLGRFTSIDTGQARYLEHLMYARMVGSGLIDTVVVVAAVGLAAPVAGGATLASVAAGGVAGASILDLASFRTNAVNPFYWKREGDALSTLLCDHNTSTSSLENLKRDLENVLGHSYRYNRENRAALTN